MRCVAVVVVDECGQIEQLGVALAAAVGVDRHGCTPDPVIQVPSLARAEWDYIRLVLESCGGNVSETARRLSISRRSLQRKLRRHPPLG
jgi:ActR/RegA family two-component response regulator